ILKNNQSLGKWLPHLSCLIVYLIWGVNVASMKYGGGAWSPIVFNGLRYLMIAPILWLFFVLSAKGDWKKMRIARRDLLLLVALGALSALGMEAMYSYALQYSNTANGALLGRGFIP